MDWTHQAPLYSTVSRSLLKFMSTESVMLSHHLMLCCPLLLLPSIFSSIRVIRNWSLSFSFSPSNDYSRLISFIDCLNSLQSKGLSRVFSNNTIQKHQVFSAQRSLWFNTHIHIWLLEKPSVQFSHLIVSDSLRPPWTAARQTSLSITNSRSLIKLMFIELVMPSNYLILCHPLFLLLSIVPSIRVFSSESALYIRWPKYWSFNFSISPSNEYSGLISFRINWFDLLAVQGTLKSLLQHTAQKHQFFGVQLSLWSNSHIHTWLLDEP